MAHSFPTASHFWGRLRARRLEARRRRLRRQLEATDPAIAALIDDWYLDRWDGMTPLQIRESPDWPPYVLCPLGPLNPAGWRSGG
ncbi:hypothetical protein B0H19DRAFT_1271043 [Mycena capillaripes]|nr:hypothetical protein B0H19DRAFT_1271043 [Mycena capillaripes]